MEFENSRRLKAERKGEKYTNKEILENQKLEDRSNYVAVGQVTCSFEKKFLFTFLFSF